MIAWGFPFTVFVIMTVADLVSKENSKIENSLRLVVFCYCSPFHVRCSQRNSEDELYVSILKFGFHLYECYSLSS